MYKIIGYKAPLKKGYGYTEDEILQQIEFSCFYAYSKVYKSDGKYYMFEEKEDKYYLTNILRGE